MTNRGEPAAAAVIPALGRRGAFFAARPELDRCRPERARAAQLTSSTASSSCSRSSAAASISPLRNQHDHGARQRREGPRGRTRNRAARNGSRSAETAPPRTLLMQKLAERKTERERETAEARRCYRSRTSRRRLRRAIPSPYRLPGVAASRPTAVPLRTSVPPSSRSPRRRSDLKCCSARYCAGTAPGCPAARRRLRRACRGPFRPPSPMSRTS